MGSARKFSAAAALVAAGCGYGEGMITGNTLPAVPAGTPQATAAVAVQNNVFVPQAALVAVGGTVTWTWVGSGHSVTAFGLPRFSPDAPVSNPPATLSVVFPAAGNFEYYCTVHGAGGVYSAGSMSGVVFVR